MYEFYIERYDIVTQIFLPIATFSMSLKLTLAFILNCDLRDILFNKALRWLPISSLHRFKKQVYNHSFTISVTD